MNKQEKKMNIKSIKKQINHEKIISEGFQFLGVQKGFFKKNGIGTVSPVLKYRKTKYTKVFWDACIETGYITQFYDKEKMIYESRGK